MGSVEERIADIEERLARLESGGDRAPRGPVEASVEPDSFDGDAAINLLQTVRERRGDRYEDGDVAGALVYAAAARFDGGEYAWAKEHPVPDLLHADWSGAARMLERLASPARLTLLAALLGGASTRAELQEALGESSTGHLYHHLRDLQAAGLLVRHRRGEHGIATHAVAPLLVIVAAALDLPGGEEGEVE